MLCPKAALGAAATALTAVLVLTVTSRVTGEPSSQVVAVRSPDPLRMAVSTSPFPGGAKA